MAEETNKHLWEEVNQDIGEVSGLLGAIKSDVRGINEALKLLRTSSNADFPETIVYRVIKQLEANLEGLEARAENHEHQILRILRKIEHNLEPKQQPAKFSITQTGGSPGMAITGIIPGSTGTFAANPADANGNPITTPLTVVPVWTSSDPLAVVTPSADGLTSSVTVDTTASQGGSFNLSVANPDGSALETVSVPYDAVTPPPNVPASFGISQTS